MIIQLKTSQSPTNILTTKNHTKVTNNEPYPITHQRITQNLHDKTRIQLTHEKYSQNIQYMVIQLKTPQSPTNTKYKESH